MKTIEYTFTYQTPSGNVHEQSIIVNARDINSGFVKATKRALFDIGRFEAVKLEFTKVV